MLFEILTAIACGIFTGIFTGITPGIHVNLVATTLLAFSPMLLHHASALSLAVFIMSLAVTHSMLDTLPSTFLGAPDPENALSVLPAQKMLLNGEAYSAVKLSVLGAYSGLVLAILLVPLFLFLAPAIRNSIRPYLPYALISIILFMILREREKFWSALLFILSGTLGLIVFSIPTLNEPLFPLLSGLFGVSGLLLSYSENNRIPAQKFDEKISVSAKELTKTLSASTLSVFFIQFFPGLGPAQGAVISSQFIRGIKDNTYLILVGAIGTMSVVFSLVTFYALGNAKDGSIVVMSKLFEINAPSFILLLFAFMLAGSISSALTLFLARRFSEIMPRINYKALVLSIICFVAIMALILGGWTSLLVLVTATSIGLVAPLKNIPRSHAMGCLLLPVALYLLL